MFSILPLPLLHKIGMIQPIENCDDEDVQDGERYILQT